MKRIMVLFAGLLAILMSISAASAITVDGLKSPGEWNDNWAFGQYNASDYDSDGPFGDRLVLFQDGSWMDWDPIADAGSGFNDNLSIEGPHPSGFDIRNLSAQYDPGTDTLYGLCEVYGLPGDLDGNGEVDTLDDNQDTAVGGPAGYGIGSSEYWHLQLTNLENDKTATIVVQNDAWSISSSNIAGLDRGDVVAKLNHTNPQWDNPTNYSVYESKINDFAEQWDVSPGDTIQVQVIAGASGDEAPGGGVLGEDIARAQVEMPNPDVEIKKYTKDMNGVWHDADSADPNDSDMAKFNEQGQTVEWRYNITNNGNVPFNQSDVSVTDSEGVIPNLEEKHGDGDNLLEPGEEWVYYNRTGEAEECGDIGDPFIYDNEGSVTAVSPVGNASDDDLSHYICERPTPEIDIEKSTNGNDADNPPGPKLVNGSTVTWTYEVTNTGTDDLENVSVTDDQLGLLPNSAIIDKGDGDDILEVGETWVYEMTGQVNCTFTNDNPYENTAISEGIGVVTDETVNDTDLSHYYCEPPTPNGVPALTPTSLMGLIGALGLIGIIGLKRRD